MAENRTFKLDLVWHDLKRDYKFPEIMVSADTPIGWVSQELRKQCVLWGFAPREIQFWEFLFTHGELTPDEHSFPGEDSLLRSTGTLGELDVIRGDTVTLKAYKIDADMKPKPLEFKVMWYGSYEMVRPIQIQYKMDPRTSILEVKEKFQEAVQLHRELNLTDNRAAEWEFGLERKWEFGLELGIDDVSLGFPRTIGSLHLHGKTIEAHLYVEGEQVEEPDQLEIRIHGPFPSQGFWMHFTCRGNGLMGTVHRQFMEQFKKIAGVDDQQIHDWKWSIEYLADDYRIGPDQFGCTVEELLFDEETLAAELFVDGVNVKDIIKDRQSMPSSVEVRAAGMELIKLVPQPTMTLDFFPSDSDFDDSDFSPSDSDDDSSDDDGTNREEANLISPDRTHLISPDARQNTNSADFPVNGDDKDSKSEGQEVVDCSFSSDEEPQIGDKVLHLMNLHHHRRKFESSAETFLGHWHSGSLVSGTNTVIAAKKNEPTCPMIHRKAWELANPYFSTVPPARNSHLDIAETCVNCSGATGERGTIRCPSCRKRYCSPQCQEEDHDGKEHKCGGRREKCSYELEGGLACDAEVDYHCSKCNNKPQFCDVHYLEHLFEKHNLDSTPRQNAILADSDTMTDMRQLWTEYDQGIGKRIAAKNFTMLERELSQPDYDRRNKVWQMMKTMIDSGFGDDLVAGNQLCAFYGGPNSSVSEIIEAVNASTEVPDIIRTIETTMRETAADRLARAVVDHPILLTDERYPIRKGYPNGVGQKRRSCVRPGCTSKTAYCCYNGECRSRKYHKKGIPATGVYVCNNPRCILFHHSEVAGVEFVDE